MHLHTYTDARQYLNQCGEFLMEHEAENCLLLSLAFRLAARSEALPDNTYLASVSDGSRIVATAGMTPPFRLILSAAPDEALGLMGDDLRSRGIEPSGVLGPKHEAALFVELWRADTGRSSHLHRAERIYQLEQVLPPSGVPGTLRTATDEDFETAVEWLMGFDSDTGMNDTRQAAERGTRLFIAEGRMFIWDDDGPVSMAVWVGPTPNGVRISQVYTPPQNRGRGYASACVAALSQYLLDTGRQYCFLFTDLANPTSNSIYQKIGYRPVIDVDAYDAGV